MPCCWNHNSNSAICQTLEPRSGVMCSVGASSRSESLSPTGGGEQDWGPTHVPEDDMNDTKQADFAIAELQKKVGTGKASVNFELMHFLKLWLTKHIMESEVRLHLTRRLIESAAAD